jgi:AcrR family transcriptional regulator
MIRTYRMGKRAEDRERTRARILAATMQVHDQKGVALATPAEIAARAGVSQATLSRHFPSYSALIQACGGHVWQEMKPPQPDTAAAVFSGIHGKVNRLQRLVEELDAFYTRGALRLDLAWRDRKLVPELEGFLTAVEAGIAALVAEALAPDAPTGSQLRIAQALAGFRVWQSLVRQGFSGSELQAVLVQTLACGLAAAAQPRPAACNETSET